MMRRVLRTFIGVYSLIDKADSESQSREVRSFVLDKLSTLFPGDELQIDKKVSVGYPVLLNKGGRWMFRFRLPIMVIIFQTA